MIPEKVKPKVEEPKVEQLRREVLEAAGAAQARNGGVAFDQFPIQLSLAVDIAGGFVRHVGQGAGAWRR
jgi:hypothetical protein